jgi:hypothetical protein
MSREQRQARAYAAKALLDDQTLQDGWAAIEADLIAELLKPASASDERAKAARETLWVEIQLLRNLRRKLANFAGLSRE